MHILITGASGMLGRRIARQLCNSGHTVAALSRSPVKDLSFTASFQWDPDQGVMDAHAFEGVDAVVHLAGAGIADRRWTTRRKEELLTSRVRSTAFLKEQLEKVPNRIHAVIAASAVGYYGDTGSRLITEADASGQGFLAETCLKWEAALQSLGNDQRRLVIFRIGFVIDRSDGALPVMARPVRFFAGAPYGDGQQYISWIDSVDLTRLFDYAVVNSEMRGVFNAVAPGVVTNEVFIRTVAGVLHRPVWPIGIPAWLLKVLLGEQSALVLDGQRVSADKVGASGFAFDFPDLTSSLEHHLN
ncbi:MAG: hypothetical protein RL021_2032 [Bacteroidota bacterium]